MFSKSKLIAALLLVLIAAETIHCCQTEIPVGACTFNVTYNPGDCYNFTFVECSYLEFVDVSFFDFQILHANSSDFNLCTRHCCNPDVVYPQNWGTIGQCKNYTEEQWILFKTKLLAGLFSSLVGGIILTIVLCFGCKLCKAMECCGFLYGGCCESFWDLVFRCTCLEADKNEEEQLEEDKAEAKTAAISVEPRVELVQEKEQSV